MKKFLIVFGFMFFMNSTSAEAECLDDFAGRTSCAPPGGGIKFSYGRAYCGIGQCAKMPITGKVFCSNSWMGWAIVKQGHPVCSGTCVAGQESLCQIP